MIQQTLERLSPLTAAEPIWGITNEWPHDAIAGQLEQVPAEHILVEPCARNTAPACALAAFLLEHTEKDTVLGVFPSKQIIADTSRFVASLTLVSHWPPGVKTSSSWAPPPTRPETGYGYIERGELLDHDALPGASGLISIHHVHRLREKPDAATAEPFLAAGNFVWNSGIFLRSVRTLAAAVREHIPDMAPILENIAAVHGAPEFESVLAAEFPKCENVSSHHAILERSSAKGQQRSNIYCLPADFKWSDIGSWASLHEHVGNAETDNVIDGETTGLYKSTLRERPWRYSSWMTRWSSKCPTRS